MTSHRNVVASATSGLLVAATLVLGTVAAPRAQQSGVQGPTFTKDVAPILQRSCQNCHRPGSIAPMSLLSYEEVRPWARSIKARVAQREMPPWYVERNIGIQKFKDDQALTDAEIAVIGKWVDAGAPQGNPADLVPRKFDALDIWHIGTPDVIVKADPYTIPATGPDRWIDFYVDAGLTEDRYIKAVEAKPALHAFKVLHHNTNYIMDPANEASGMNDARSVLLNEYAAGKGGDVFPEGTGRLIKAGSKIHFNLHYHPYGEETKDQTMIGLILYPKGYVPKHVLNSRQLGSTGELDIPAGQVVRSDGYERFNTAVKLTSFQPHLHNRGKRECLEALYPDGSREMLNCAGFNFGWAINYIYADDVAPILPAGSILHVINWHDNTASNRGNPDPRNWVGNGNRTIDEMSFSWVSWHTLTDQEYEQELGRRRSTTPTAQQQ